MIVTAEWAPLFATIGGALSNVDRRMPDGRTIAELAPDAVQLAAFERHVWTLCTGWSRVGAEYGAQQIMALLAVYAGRYCWRWWLAPGWPDVVGEFVRRLDEPARWRDPEIVGQVTRVGVLDIDGGELRDLLLAGPDRLTPTTAAQCLRAGLGDLLPQDCGQPGLPRHPLPLEYLHLVAPPKAWDPPPT